MTSMFHDEVKRHFGGLAIEKLNMQIKLNLTTKVCGLGILLVIMPVATPEFLFGGYSPGCV